MARLRRTQAKIVAHEKLFMANRYLGQGTPESISTALKLYTDVLYTDSPGHLCALLNRSLAFIALGYPELAVVDAHRSAQICYEARRVHDIKKSELDPNRRIRIGLPGVTNKWTFVEPGIGTSDAPLGKIIKSTYSYLSSEQLHLRSNSNWTVKPQCWIRQPFTRWLQGNLATIVLGEPLGRENVRPVIELLEARAVYRLAGALWMCGQGAVSDALGLVSDTITLNLGKVRYWTLTWDDLDEFESLGSAILSESCNKAGTLDKESAATTKTKTTLVNRVVYPWNTHHPRMENYRVKEELRLFCNNVAAHCSVEYDEASTNTPFALRLVAAQRIQFGGSILREPTVLQAATPGYEKYMRCDHCSARLIVSSSMPSSERSSQKSAPKSVSGRQSPSIAAPCLGSDPSQRAQDMIITNRGTDGTASESPEMTDAPQSTSGMEYLSDTDTMETSIPSETLSLDSLNKNKSGGIELSGCPRCQLVVYCSQYCKAISEITHSIVCCNQTEEALRIRLGCATRDTDSLELTEKEIIVLPKIRYLHQKILLKIVGIAEARMENPLAIEEVKWLNGGLLEAPQLPAFADYGGLSSDEGQFLPGSHVKKLPWSFNDNVIAPLTMLKNMGVSAWNDLDKYDGWILNTLYAKIEHSMRVTRGFKFIKLYDEEGKWTAEGAAGEFNDLEVLIGSIHPVFSLIPEAVPANEQVANVVFFDTEEMLCTAAPSSSTDDCGDVTMSDIGEGWAIDRGENLYRNGDMISLSRPIVGRSHSNTLDSLGSWVGHVGTIALGMDIETLVQDEENA